MTRLNERFIIAATKDSVQCLTVDLLKTHFRLEGRNVLWVKPTAKKTRVGDVAGCNIKSTARPKSYGLRVFFHGHLLKAEEIAFALHHGRFARGRVLHLDNDRTNNTPDNLFEVAKHCSCSVHA